MLFDARQGPREWWAARLEVIDQPPTFHMPSAEATRARKQRLRLRLMQKTKSQSGRPYWSLRHTGNLQTFFDVFD